MARQGAECMCGAVKFTAEPLGEPAGVCHCRMCRRWSGGVFISVGCADVTFEDDAPLNVFESSPWGERISCAKCGSSLIWRGKDGGMSMVSVQMFEDPGQFEIGSEIFIDEKPESYALACGDTQKMTGAEVMAMYTAPGGA